MKANLLSFLFGAYLIACSAYAGGLANTTCAHCSTTFNGLNLFGQFGVINAHVNVSNLTGSDTHIPSYGLATGFDLSVGLGIGWYRHVQQSPTVIGFEGYFNWLNGSINNQTITIESDGSVHYPHASANFSLQHEWYVGASIGQAYKTMRAYVGAGYLQIKVNNTGYFYADKPLCKQPHYVCKSPLLKGLRTSIGLETLYWQHLSATVEVNYSITNGGPVVEFVPASQVLSSSLARLNYLSAMFRLGYRWR